jgi:hypothetical protein
MSCTEAIHCCCCYCCCCYYCCCYCCCYRLLVMSLLFTLTLLRRMAMQVS